MFLFVIGVMWLLLLFRFRVSNGNHFKHKIHCIQIGRGVFFVCFFVWWCEFESFALMWEKCISFDSFNYFRMPFSFSFSFNFMCTYNMHARFNTRTHTVDRSWNKVISLGFVVFIVAFEICIHYSLLYYYYCILPTNFERIITAFSSHKNSTYIFWMENKNSR